MGQTKKEIETIFKHQCEKARVKEVITYRQSQQLVKLFMDHREEFVTKNSITRLSGLPPMEVHLKPDADPIFEESGRLSPYRKEGSSSS